MKLSLERINDCTMMTVHNVCDNPSGICECSDAADHDLHNWLFKLQPPYIVMGFANERKMCTAKAVALIQVLRRLSIPSFVISECPTFRSVLIELVDQRTIGVFDTYDDAIVGATETLGHSEVRSYLPAELGKCLDIAGFAKSQANASRPVTPDQQSTSGLL